MAYACIPASPVDIAAEIHRHHRQLAALTRWVKLCGRDADEAALARNDELYTAVHAEAQALIKAQRRIGR